VCRGFKSLLRYQAEPPQNQELRSASRPGWAAFSCRSELQQFPLIYKDFRVVSANRRDMVCDMKPACHCPICSATAALEATASIFEARDDNNPERLARRLRAGIATREERELAADQLLRRRAAHRPQLLRTEVEEDLVAKFLKVAIAESGWKLEAIVSSAWSATTFVRGPRYSKFWSEFGSPHKCRLIRTAFLLTSSRSCLMCVSGSKPEHTLHDDSSSGHSAVGRRA
jgi:hypothetical protein